MQMPSRKKRERETRNKPHSHQFTPPEMTQLDDGRVETRRAV